MTFVHFASKFFCQFSSEVAHELKLTVAHLQTSKSLIHYHTYVLKQSLKKLELKVAYFYESLLLCCWFSFSRTSLTLDLSFLNFHMKLRLESTRHQM